jgi:hypothetical protein
MTLGNCTLTVVSYNPASLTLVVQVGGGEVHTVRLAEWQGRLAQGALPLEVLHVNVLARLLVGGTDLTSASAVATAIQGTPFKWQV